MSSQTKRSPRALAPMISPALALAAALAGCTAAPVGSDRGGDAGSVDAIGDPTDIVMRYEWRGDIDESGIPEPSGIVHHRRRDSLFVVGDEGEILEMGRDGEPINQRTLEAGADLEGVTCDPATGLLYIAVEGEEAVLEVEPETLEVQRRFELPRRYRGRTVMAEGGEGIESIAFVPDPDHRHGGTFFVANQAFTLDNPEDTSALIEVELPIGESAGADGAGARILACHRIEVIDLSGSHYDARTDRLLVTCDSPNALFEVTRDGRLLRGWALPGDEQEGLAIIDRDQLYIAQDVGGVLHIRWKNR